MRRARRPSRARMARHPKRAREPAVTMVVSIAAQHRRNRVRRAHLLHPLPPKRAPKPPAQAQLLRLQPRRLHRVRSRRALPLARAAARPRIRTRRVRSPSARMARTPTRRSTVAHVPTMVASPSGWIRASRFEEWPRAAERFWLVSMLAPPRWRRAVRNPYTQGFQHMCDRHARALNAFLE